MSDESKELQEMSDFHFSTDLSERDYQILDLRIQGKTFEQIATK